MTFFMFAWPAVWFLFLIYAIGPLLLRPNGTLPGWAFHLVWLLGNGAELAAALIILRQEGYPLTPKALQERINWRFPDKLWKWGAIVGVFIAAAGLSMLLSPVATEVATTLPPPDWMPGHPLKETTFQEQYPDVNIVGNVPFLLYRVAILGFVMNMIGEELYYRGALQPKMRGTFGRWDWVANGIGFALKHVYFWWRLPYLWASGLAFAFIFGPMGSLPLSILLHWIGNFEPFILVQLLIAVLGGG